MASINKEAWKADVKRIQAALKNLCDENENPVLLSPAGACVALIQRPAEPEDSGKDDRKYDDQKKSALRAAFGSLGITSQMIRHFPDDDEKGLQIRHSNPQLEDRSRVLQAVSNLLITSLGVTYGAPAAHYAELLGFERAFAEKIVVEYWVRHRVAKLPKADYIAVVRQHANGYLDFILPDPESGKPQAPRPAYEVGPYLQTLFSRGNKPDRVYGKSDDRPEARVLTFFKEQLSAREQPTLIVPQVGDWRSRETAWFHDDAVQFGQVTIANLTRDASQLKNVRIVKMLTDEAHNLRYWLDHEGLVAAHDHLASIPTIYSMDAEKEDPESGIEDRLQRNRVIELAALLMQAEDDEARQFAWCQIPHLSRIHPGWSRKAIVYPYPVHVMHHLIDDALWAVFDEASR
jgi:hypothetical protein